MNVKKPTPSVEVSGNSSMNRKQVTQCVLRNGKWCQIHECEATVFKTSKKVWAWLKNKNQYGYKYVAVKSVNCRVMNVANRDTQAPNMNVSTSGR